MAVSKVVIVCLMLFGTLTGASAQLQKVPPLERVVSITLTNESIEASLKKIGKTADINFSYRSSLFETRQVVTAQFSGKTVREILDFIFKGEIAYKERGRYVILVKAEKQASAKDAKVFDGYVIDEATGQRLKNVSVYDPVSLSSSVTDAYGYFKIEIKSPTAEEVRLAIQKNQYSDTVVVVPVKNRGLLRVPIRINKEKWGTMADSVGSKLKRFWFDTRNATQQAVNMENISDTLHQPVQFSFVPFVGTNGKLSGNVINDYSVNLLGGYSLGNRKAEFGGLFNAERGDVSGVQVAGLANGVFGQQNGVQVAGLANLTGGNAEGVQVAGIANVNLSSRHTVSVAGLLNFTDGDTRSVSLAGLGNFVSGQQHGPHFAGLFNFTAKQVDGHQISGVLNFSGGDASGLQLAGVSNFAGGNIVGSQVSGVFNYAGTVRGAQIGLINVTKSISGVPVGLLSFVAKGYHKLEVSADEIFYTNIAFRTGVRQFHNILSVGAKPNTFSEDKTFWSFGYGLGTAPKITKWLWMNFDLTVNKLLYGEVKKLNLLNKLYGGLDFQVTKNFSIVAGATLNAYLTDPAVEYPELFSGISPEIIHERTVRDDINMKMWVGGKIGVRFF